MIPVQYIDPDDLPLYAMKLLPAEEMERMRLHLQHSAEARTALAEIYGELAAYAHTAEMEDPPATAKHKLMKQVKQEKKAEAMDRVGAAVVPAAAVSNVQQMPARRSAAGRVLPWVGWAVAAGLAVEAGHLYQQRQGLDRTLAEERQQDAQTTLSAEQATAVLETFKDPAAQNVVLTSAQVKPVPEGRASYNPEKGSLVFLASNLARLAPAKTYELWLIPADGRPAIPAGTFHPDAQGYASVILPQLPKGIVAKEFGVTVEEEGGSPRPTSAIILAGLAAQPA